MLLGNDLSGTIVHGKESAPPERGALLRPGAFYQNFQPGVGMQAVARNDLNGPGEVPHLSCQAGQDPNGCLHGRKDSMQMLNNVGYYQW
jgi:hypothetical protein